METARPSGRSHSDTRTCRLYLASQMWSMHEATLRPGCSVGMLALIRVQ